MSNSKRIKEKVHFYVSKLAGAVQYSLLNDTLVTLQKTQRNLMKNISEIIYFI